MRGSCDVIVLQNFLILAHQNFVIASEQVNFRVFCDVKSNQICSPVNLGLRIALIDF